MKYLLTHGIPKRNFYTCRTKTVSSWQQKGGYNNESHNRWTRTYTLGKNELKIEDRFSLDRAETPNQINFLTWGTVDISRPGEVIVTVEKT